jgi:hypothetical protein
MIRESKLEDFEYLFSDQSGRYVLIQSGDDDSRDLSTCVVYDQVACRGLIIEDDELGDQVIKRLHALGRPILPNIPE